jgi:hypothetical protein
MMEIENENYNCSLWTPLSRREPDVRREFTNTALPGRRVRSAVRLRGWCGHESRIADSRLLVGSFGAGDLFFSRAIAGPSSRRVLPRPAARAIQGPKKPTQLDAADSSA